MTELFDYEAQPKIVVERCNLCGSNDITSMLTEDRYGFLIQVAECLTCGLVFLNPRMTPESYQAFYETAYRPLVSAYHGRVIDASTIQAEQQLYARWLSDLLWKFIPFSSRLLLDIGGSTGVIASELAGRFGLHATILDPSPDEGQEALRRGHSFVQGIIESARLTESYDLITMCQTVDHLLDIQMALERVRFRLSAESLFFIDAVTSWQYKIDHPYYLNDATMRAYLTRAGFHILKACRGYALPGQVSNHMAYICRAK